MFYSTRKKSHLDRVYNVFHLLLDSESQDFDKVFYICVRNRDRCIVLYLVSLFIFVLVMLT